MTDLFWPGAERAGTVLSDRSFLEDMTAVEQAWLSALVAAGVAPLSADRPLSGLLATTDLAAIASRAEASGTPVLGLLELLRSTLSPEHGEAARWLHRGLTSQDVVDTALVLGLRTAIGAVRDAIRRQVATMIGLAERHRTDILAGRTLTQHAAPVTVGAKLTSWLTAVLDAEDGLGRLAATLPAQLGGAVGTNAALVELCAGVGGDPIDRAATVLADVADRLGLAARPPWHTVRSPITGAGDALVGACDAFGRIAGDVLVLNRPEIGEVTVDLAGSSSTMPHKRNPVLAVLVRRAALTAPALGSVLHLSFAGATDERPAGEWHAEWPIVRTLGRTALVAAEQTASLLDGLHVSDTVMRTRAVQVADELLSERQALRTAFPSGTGSADPATDDLRPDSYLGAVERYLDVALDRGRTLLERAG